MGNGIISHNQRKDNYAVKYKRKMHFKRFN